VLALYMLDLGATVAQVGLILSLQSLLKILFTIPLTILAQRVREGRMITISFIPYGFTPNPRTKFCINRR
jgi:cyanate permease